MTEVQSLSVAYGELPEARSIAVALAPVIRRIPEQNRNCEKLVSLEDTNTYMPNVSDIENSYDILYCCLEKLPYRVPSLAYVSSGCGSQP